MNDNLNDRIRNLFLAMINCPEKIIGVNANEIKFDNGISIKYWNDNGKDVDNESLKLKSQNFSIDFWALSIKISDHLVFTINTPYRQYYVPDFTDRMGYARVLDTLDKDLTLFEQGKLEEYELHFTNRVQKSDSSSNNFYVPSSSKTEEPF